MYKDDVKCNNCEFDGLVDLGEEKCPECNFIGALSWKENEKQEVLHD